MIPAIRASLGPTIGLGALGSAALHDIFEAYVFSLIVSAAQKEGAQVHYEDVRGNRVTALLFRTSPGYLHSTAQRYTHAVVVFPNRPELEIHIGVMVTGKSGVVHEADVAVIDRIEANTCRAQQVPPRSSKTLLVVECKYYGSLLQLGLGRGFIGLASDFSASCIFVSNTESQSVAKLLTNRGKQWEKNIEPTRTNDVERLLNEFKKTFMRFKSR